jgi:hypothetical protein
VVLGIENLAAQAKVALLGAHLEAHPNRAAFILIYSRLYFYSPLSRFDSQLNSPAPQRCYFYSSPHIRAPIKTYSIIGGAWRSLFWDSLSPYNRPYIFGSLLYFLPSALVP